MVNARSSTLSGVTPRKLPHDKVSLLVLFLCWGHEGMTEARWIVPLINVLLI